jgi:hypothetical protein
VTLREWKSRLQLGTRLRCVFRHYKPEVDETVVIKKVQGNAVAWDYDGGTGSLSLKPHQLAWMYFPKANELKQTDKGFELYFPDGRLMSRYEWVQS